MVIVETDTGQEYDFWHASVSASILRAGTGSVENVKTADGTKAGGDAAGLALSGGLLRPSELASGHIDHALAIDIPCISAHGRDIGYVWPATGGWGDSCGQHWSESTSGAPAIGQLFQLNMTDAQIAASGAPAWQQTIMTASRITAPTRKTLTASGTTKASPSLSKIRPHGRASPSPPNGSTSSTDSAAKTGPSPPQSPFPPADSR